MADTGANELRGTPRYGRLTDAPGTEFDTVVDTVEAIMMPEP